MIMEKCPGCGRFTLDDSGSEYKCCFTTGCSCRIYRDGSVSFIKYDSDKIRRVRRYPNGTEENMREFSHLQTKNDAISKRLPPGYPPFGRKVKLLVDHQINYVHVIQAPEKIALSNTGVLKFRDTERIIHINPIIPAGTIGIVGDEPFSGTIIDYNFECPVQFIHDPFVPKTIGVPWNMLEFAD